MCRGAARAPAGARCRACRLPAAAGREALLGVPGLRCCRARWVLLGPAGEAERAAAARGGVGPAARPRGTGHRGRGLGSHGPAAGGAVRAPRARPPPLEAVALNAVEV